MTSVSGAAAPPSLVRGIRRWDFVALIVNITIGAGILGLPARLYALAGTYSLEAYVASAAIVTLIILCFAEVSSRFNGAGGPYLYAREAFGPLEGFEVGWLLWLSRLASFAALCNLFVDYAAYFWPAVGAGVGRALLMTTLVAVLTALNLVGVRLASLVNNLFTISKLLLLLVFVAVGLFFVRWSAFSWAAPPTLPHFSSAVLLLIFTFSGFDVAAIPAGEIEQPQRNVPFALFTAIATVAVLFVLVQGRRHQRMFVEYQLFIYAAGAAGFALPHLAGGAVFVLVGPAARRRGARHVRLPRRPPRPARRVWLGGCTAASRLILKLSCFDKLSMTEYALSSTLITFYFPMSTISPILTKRAFTLHEDWVVVVLGALLIAFRCWACPSPRRLSTGIMTPS